MSQAAAPEALWAESVPEAPYPMSLHAFARWPGEDAHYELVRGRLVRSAPRTFGHLVLTSRILQGILACDAQHPGFWAFGVTGTFCLQLPKELQPTALAPAAALVCRTQLPALETSTWRQLLDVVPEWVIEIATQGQEPEGLAAKARLWLAAGARLVWIIWPHQQQVTIWRRGREAAGETLGVKKTLEGDGILSGFSLPVAKLFQG